MTLYELTGDYLSLLDMAEDPDVDEQVLADTLEGIEGAIEDKADGYAKVIAQVTADADLIGEEIKRLQARKKTLENNDGRMKRALQGAMTATGKEKFKTLLFSFSVQNNPPKLFVSDDAKIPKKFYIKQDPKLDSIALKKAVAEGAKIKGVELIQERSLRIR